LKKLEKIALLTSLYAAQGLPFGFFTQALPVFLRKNNLALPAIGASYLLTIPWAMKFLWAPAVDRIEIPGFGLRRSWIIPLQLLSIALFILLSRLNPSENLPLIMMAFLATNLFAASQDIATDGLAIDILDFSEHGWANGIQVAAYRIGMIIGGGAILYSYESLGWSGSMLTMALIAGLCTAPILLYREPEHARLEKLKPVRSSREALREVGHFLLTPGVLSWVGILLLYKTAHASATGMLRPWLVDQGYSLQDIAWILGSAGFVAGFLGAVGGGLLASRFERKRLLLILGFLQCLAVTSYLYPVLTEHATFKVTLAVALDHFTSGLATTTLFTLMMDACDPDRAGTDYTTQACLVVIATGLASALSGVSADHLGYQTHFVLSAALAFASMAVTAWLLYRPSVKTLFTRTAPGALSAPGGDGVDRGH
jgi:MFS family permease